MKKELFLDLIKKAKTLSSMYKACSPLSVNQFDICIIEASKIGNGCEISPGYMVYSADFNALLANHIESEADITLLYHSVDNARES